jgi:hypothetical protein
MTILTLLEDPTEEKKLLTEEVEKNEIRSLSRTTLTRLFMKWEPVFESVGIEECDLYFLKNRQNNPKLERFFKKYYPEIKRIGTNYVRLSVTGTYEENFFYETIMPQYDADIAKKSIEERIEYSTSDETIDTFFSFGDKHSSSFISSSGAAGLPLKL